MPAPVTLIKRGGGPTPLTGGDFDANMIEVEDWTAAAEAELNALQAGSGQTNRYVDLRDFAGIDLDGNNDSTADINTALMQAYAASYPCYMPAGAVRVSTIKLPTRTEFVGAGISHSRIISTGANAPIVASRNYFLADGHPIEGRSRIAHFRIEGDNDQTKASQHGILFRDFFSTLEHLEIKDTGGNAIRAVNTNNASTAITTTLVNNRYQHIACYNIRGTSVLHLGAQANASLTDGHLHDIYIGSYRTAGTGGGTQIYIGNAAGWSISKIHSYVYHPTLAPAIPDASIHLYTPWHCTIDEIYIEQWLNSGIYFQGNSGVCSVSRVHAICDSTTVGGSVLYFDRTPGASPVFRVDGLMATKDTGTNQFYGITAGDGARVNLGEPVTIAGARSGDLLANRKLLTGTIYTPADAGGTWNSV